MTQKFFITAVAISLLACAGCKTISSQGVETLASGVTAAKTQSEEAFSAINDLIAEDQVTDAAKAANLTEQLFAPVLDPEDVAAWDQTLAKLESYATHLQTLASPEISQSFEQETENLGGELQTFGDDLKQTGVAGGQPHIPPGVATAFTELGSLIIRARSQRDAVQIAAAANASVNNVLKLMAGSLGETSKKGLRGTVREHWLGRLGDLEEQFKSQTDPAARREIAGQFLDAMKRRDAQDAVLASLRRSLLNLSALHQSLARGDKLTAARFANDIAQEVKASRDIYTQFQQKLGK